MKKSIVASVSLGMMLFGMATAAQAGLITYSKKIYEAGASEGGVALNETGDTYGDGGSNIISWYFEVYQSGYATLSITAEGIDSGINNSYPDGEVDNVKMQYETSGEEYLGDLAQQGFYSEKSFLKAGEGWIDGITAETTTLFELGFLEAGKYTFRVYVADSTNGHAWVNEIETSTLKITPVPEPNSMLLLGTGLVGLAAISRKK